MIKQYLDFTISDDKSKLQTDAVCRLLHKTHWAKNRPCEVIEASFENAVCFGVYDKEQQQVGFARCVTDFATVYWLCDVVIDEKCRGFGLGKALVETALAYEGFSQYLGILISGDSKSLYQRYGFCDMDGNLLGKPGL